MNTLYKIFIISYWAVASINTAVALSENQKNRDVETTQKEKAFQLNSFVACEKGIDTLLELSGSSSELNNQRVEIMEFLNQLFQKLGSGERTEYADVTVIPGVKLNSEFKSAKYFSISKLLGKIISSKRYVVLGFDANELRYLPHVQRGVEVILIPFNPEVLDMKKINAVINVAERNDIRISLVYFDNNAHGDMSLLKKLVASTGGTILEFKGDKACLSPRIAKNN